MSSAPETLRSPGVPPKVAPPRRVAWATFEVVRYGEAIVEVIYLGTSELWSLFRVQLRNPDLSVSGVDPLYELAYCRACAAAGMHGYEVERFSRKAAA